MIDTTAVLRCCEEWHCSRRILEGTFPPPPRVTESTWRETALRDLRGTTQEISTWCGDTRSVIDPTPLHKLEGGWHKRQIGHSAAPDDAALELLIDDAMIVIERIETKVRADLAPDDAPHQYVTLSQIALIVRRSKRTLERLQARRINPFPPPAVEGGGGHAAEWLWSEIRPWLIKEFGRQLPERYPAG